MDFSPDRIYFYCIQSSNNSGKFTIIRYFCRSNLVYDIWRETRCPTTNHKRIYKLIMDLTPIDKHYLSNLLNFSKIFLENFLLKQ